MLNIPSSYQTIQIPLVESLTIIERRHVMQLASGCLQSLGLASVWHGSDRAVRYSDLKRDMPHCPPWFETLLRPMNGVHEFGVEAAIAFEGSFA